ncbi:BglG family transcription antiterminator [Tepidibacillus sp. HK-1]|uniref:BglG family transcription antiterminator n=1 Tax=Tepidibacillus sp. HK-1 TaxID=1883407 RepID=UPI0008539AA5|nr:BglG family transcription antiterminator [Tepidibacillus sp. HK-1]GBF10743.1 putative licABCH operon regulator [Tepidibacillus sp. HK-1]
MFSKRQIEILLSLMEAKKPVTSEWIAKELGLSDRTIRNEIKAIQPECPKLGISIESIRGKGYQLKILDQTLFETIFSQLTNESKDEIANEFSNQNDRVIYLLKQLLLEKEPIKLENFEDEMFVSKSTIQNDLKIVRQILLKYNLKLVNRPHYGTMVKGDEYMRRLCLSNHIFNRHSDISIDQESSQLLDQELFEKIKEIIIKKVNHYKVEISDISLGNLAIHIAIACKRIEEGFIIEHLKDHFTKEYPFEKIVAKEIVEEVQGYTKLTFPESEIDYIIVHLLGTKLLHKKELTEFSEFDEAGSIVQCMLKRLRTELNWDFENDIEFIQALTLHIRPAMNRLRYKMNIRNPLLNEIKIKYPSAFEGAVLASKCIEEYLSIEPGEHEIAYIALHIGVALERMKGKHKKVKRVIVVCASGVGSAKLLYYRLQHLFENELEIVASINYYKLVEYDLSSIDFIISTIPIKEDLGIPVQVVNTFLGDEDINRIEKYLYKDNQDGLSLYLDPSRVFIHQELEDKESVIRFLCNELYKQGLVTNEYKKLVLERESLAPTSFGNLVAIPHPLSPVTEETFWTLCTLKHPILWHGNQMVQVVCLLNIQKGPKGNLENMYQKLIKVVENKTIVQKIIKSQSVNEIIKILHEN